MNKLDAVLFASKLAANPAMKARYERVTIMQEAQKEQELKAREEAERKAKEKLEREEKKAKAEAERAAAKAAKEAKYAAAAAEKARTQTKHDTKERAKATEVFGHRVTTHVSCIHARLSFVALSTKFVTTAGG